MAKLFPIRPKAEAKIEGKVPHKLDLLIWVCHPGLLVWSAFLSCCFLGLR